MEIQGVPDILWFQSALHIVARGPNGELLQFFDPGDRWHKADLTDLAKREGPGLDAVDDVLIAGDPHANEFFWVDGRGPGWSMHVVARSRDGKLLEWSWHTHDATWRVVSLTDYAAIAEEDRAEVGYPLIAGNPHAYSLTVGGGDTYTQHVVARARDSMQLLEWSWSSIDQTWRVVSLTGHRTTRVGSRLGGALIVGDPHGYAFTTRGENALVNTQHVVARSPENRLLEWSWGERDQTWRVVSLTDHAGIAEEEDRAEVGDARIAGDPHGNEFRVWSGSDTQFTQHVVARSPADHLLQWSWSSRDATWRVVSLSGRRALRVGAGVGAAQIAGAPHVHAFTQGYGRDVQYTQHIVARSFDDRLLQWSWSSRDQTWRVVSLTDRATKEGPGVGEALVASDPRGASLRVVARGLPPDDRLLQWRWNVPDGWRVRDSFPTAVG
jgi:hypothetical protein